MDWTTALEQVIERTGHGRFRELCSDDHPDHPSWRQIVVEKATGLPAPRAEYPPVATMARGAAGAIGRAVGAAVTGRAVLVPAEVYAARLDVCRGCPHFDPGPLRCRLCGCKLQLKLRSAREKCPDSPPRWHEWEAPKDGDDGT